ncbi:response regulator transcription factor [Streptomyces sp. NBC_01304]|uniref:response regulator transcription factor n=1 Tax=Streptomyces sp. NBC_01304 TaxID=2903818 RepID=UPI002E12ADAE|nr:response regulator transcription factor [Streptomyces sp. NBC_01304]
MHQHILVVDGDCQARDRLISALRRQGFAAGGVGTGDAALQKYGDADLILMDFDLPDLDGLEVCRAIRAASDIPIIVLTARDCEVDRVLGLQAGADDYMVKPYGFRELIARIQAVTRRAKPRPRTAEVMECGPLRIDAGAREVTLHGVPVGVTRKEFDVLQLLASHPDAVVPRKLIMQQVWGGSWSRRTVDTHVSSLRGKLGDSEWIVTVRGVGFRLAVPALRSVLRPTA